MDHKPIISRDPSTGEWCLHCSCKFHARGDWETMKYRADTHDAPITRIPTPRTVPYSSGLPERAW